MEKEYLRGRYRKQIDKFIDDTYEMLVDDERFCFTKKITLKERKEYDEIIKNVVDKRFSEDLPKLEKLVMLGEGLTGEENEKLVHDDMTNVLLDFKTEANYDTLKRYRFSKKFLHIYLPIIGGALLLIVIIVCIVLGTKGY